MVRYGNVMASRGSVIPFFMKVRETGVLPITDERMTRFWITLQGAVDFVLKSLERMQGGEVFVPKIPSMRIVDLAKAIAPECELEIIGIRPGEKLHEVMVPEDDSWRTLEFDDRYVILPSFCGETLDRYADQTGGRVVQEGFRYASDNNTDWLGIDQLQQMVGIKEPELVD